MSLESQPIAEVTSGRLRLSVVRTGDRYTHSLEAEGARLDAVEHPKFETPVYTDLHRQGDMLFLSGMAGGRHWSASIEPQGGGFLFDLACRVKRAFLPTAVAYHGAGLRIEGAGAEGPVALVRLDGDLALALPAEEVEPLPATLRLRFRVVGA